MKKLFAPDHRLQKDILSGLRHANFVRFSELKPSRIESNLFLYHLRQLIKAGLVIKSDEGYGLSDEGKVYVARLSKENQVIRVQPTLLSVLCVHDSEKQQWLITKRFHQPYIGITGFPSGKIHEGESFADAAQRELADKCNLDSIALVQKGVFEMKYMQDAKLFRHVVGIVSYGTHQADSGYEFVKQDFRSYWADESVLLGPNTFPQHKKIIELCKGKDTFIESFEIK